MEVIRKTSHEPYARKRSVSSSVLVVTDSGSDWKSSLASTDSFDRKLQLIEAKKARFADTIFKAKQKTEDCNKFKAGFNIDDGNNVVKHDEKQSITAKKALSRKRPYEHTTMREGKKIADFKKDQDLKVSKKKLKAEKEKDCKRSDDRSRRRDYSSIRREVLEKQRESARMALLEMEKSVGTEDNIDVMREYVRLCGCLADSYETVFHILKLESLDWFLEPEKEDDKTAREDQVHSYNKKMDCKRDDDCHHNDSMISREAIEKQRESARMALLQMEKSVEIEDNIDVMAEYERLCGCDADSYGTVFHDIQLESLDWLLELED
ncbi:hypothetical protein TIFTF001_025769 [Ficus carica]|uniref:Uncharacterized protein n=1 Tax=Ficus carica TaxID=3494 RepID=A0AA88DKM2_FICCA|nr:hypothetical protein TIFTF001_025769 [Ficus carica]